MSAERHPALGLVGPIAKAARSTRAADAAAAAAHRHRDDLIVQALLAGLTMAQVARAAGMSYANVRVIARRRGVRLAPGPKPGR